MPSQDTDKGEIEIERKLQGMTQKSRKRKYRRVKQPNGQVLSGRKNTAGREERERERDPGEYERKFKLKKIENGKKNKTTTKNKKKDQK